jgi:hypothetical protein
MLVDTRACGTERSVPRRYQRFGWILCRHLQCKKRKFSPSYTLSQTELSSVLKIKIFGKVLGGFRYSQRNFEDSSLLGFYAVYALNPYRRFGKA